MVDFTMEEAGTSVKRVGLSIAANKWTLKIGDCSLTIYILLFHLDLHCLPKYSFRSH